MEPSRFDTLSRSLAAPRTRRGLFGTLTALGAGLIGAHAAGAQVSQISCGNQACASNPGVCKPGCVCCAYTNSITGQVINSRCRPPGTCSPGTVACPPGQVLTAAGVCGDPVGTITLRFAFTVASCCCWTFIDLAGWAPNRTYDYIREAIGSDGSIITLSTRQLTTGPDGAGSFGNLIEIPKGTSFRVRIGDVSSGWAVAAC